MNRSEWQNETTDTGHAPADVFTAAQIARALGVTARAVQLRLKGCPQSAPVTVRGQKANAWSFQALPEALRAELLAAARDRGHADVTQLLANPPEPWSPTKPWHEIPQAFKDLALKLCAALAPALARQHELSGPDLVELAQAGYRQQFGHTIEEDKVRYVMDRATKRDNGFGRWQRPELYLDEAAFHQPESAALDLRGIYQPLDSEIAGLEDPERPSLEDRAHLFHVAFGHLDALEKQHPAKGDRRALKASLIEYLYRHLPGLYQPHADAKSENGAKPLLALRRLFNLLYGAWVQGGRTVEALRDARAGKCGRKGYKCPTCEKKIRALAAKLRGEEGKKGNVGLAINLLVEKAELCPKCLPRFRDKKLSSSVRVRITPNSLEVAAQKGPDAVRRIAPTHHCDWSDMEPGDRFVIDDMTSNEPAWDEVDGEIVSGPVQMLRTEDEVSLMPLPFWMYFGHPNSRTIKKELWMVLTLIGLPHISLYTERGVFANRMVAGERGAKEAVRFYQLQDALAKLIEFGPMDEAALAKLRKLELGLRDPALGLNIQQATSPQAKTIERSFYELQKRTSLLPGFGGFCQRFERPRHLADFDRRVAAGNEHPGNEYLHISDLRKNYEQAELEFAHRGIKGMRHRGRSPLVFWNETMQRRPLRKLPEEIEPLFATRRIPSIKVHSWGIKIEIDQFEDAYYFNDATGPLVDRRVAAYVNYDVRDFIHIEHPDTGKLFKVERAQTRRRTATPEEIAKVRAARRAHILGARGEAGNVNIEGMTKSWLVRDTAYTPSDLEKARTMAQDTKSHQVERAALKRLAGALGATVPANPRNAQRTREGLELERQAAEEIAAMENANQKEKSDENLP